MRNLSTLRNFMRMITYENRLYSYTDGLHSMFVGKDKIVNVLKRNDAKQTKKHLDFLRDFTHNIKNIRVYYERNKEAILKDGRSSNRSNVDIDALRQRIQAINECVARLERIKDLPNPFG